MCIAKLAYVLRFLLAAECIAQSVIPPRAITWREAQDRFRANNPSLLAGEVAVDEARANETTAFLRPNPNLTLGWDQLTPFSTNPDGRWRSRIYFGR